MKPRLGVSINIDKLTTYCIIKINLYSYAIALSTNCAVYFTMFVQTNLVHGTLSAVNNFKYPFGRLFGRKKFMNIHGLRVIHIET